MARQATVRQHCVHFAIVLASAFAGESLARSPEFIALGARTQALGLSSNGAVLVGGLGSVSNGAFRWTREGGLAILPVPPEGRGSFARATSWDGSAIVGSYGGSRSDAAVWYGSDAPVEIGIGDAAFDPFGISDDGRTIVTSSRRSSHTSLAVYRDGQTQGLVLPLPPGFTSVRASGVSGDGRTVLGEGTLLDGRTQALKWTEDGGFSALPMFANHNKSYGNDASFDGSVIVGNELRVPGGRRAFIWTAAGVTFLPQSNSEALAISADGRVIVGASSNRAAFWVDGQINFLDTFLTARGVNLTGWRLEGITGVSSNGEVMCGVGSRNGTYESFYVTIPTPGTLAMLGVVAIGGIRRRRRHN